jgi:hypothetical protein
MKTLQDVLSKEMLEYEYNKTSNQIKTAKSLGISIDSVRKYLKLYNIIVHKKPPHKKYSCNEKIFATDTETSFYLAGFIAADGNVRSRKRKHSYSKILRICLSSKDKHHIEKIKTLLDSNHKITSFIAKPTKKAKNPSPQTAIEITSDNLIDDLARFNVVPNKTFIYSMPKWLADHPLIHHFIRGYFDGDGCIGFYYHKGCSCLQGQFNMLGTEMFTTQCRDILIINCALSKNKILKRENIFSITYGGNKAISRIYNFLYKDSTIYLDRKYNKFMTNINLL